MKENLPNGRKYLKIIYLIMNSYPKYIKKSNNSIAHKTNNLILKKGRESKQTFLQRRLRRPTGT